MTNIPSASRRRAVLLLAAVFVGGLLLGAAATLLGLRHLVSNPPADGWLKAPLVAALARDLDLDRTQRERVDAIVGETREELLVLADRVEPDVREILGRARERIRAELRPDQRERFDDEVARRTERWVEVRRRFRSGRSGSSGTDPATDR